LRAQAAWAGRPRAQRPHLRHPSGRCAATQLQAPHLQARQSQLPVFNARFAAFGCNAEGYCTSSHCQGMEYNLKWLFA